MTIKFNTIRQNTKLELGKIYQVICIHFIPTQEPGNFEIMYRIINENGVAAMYPQAFFELADKKLDNDFVF